MKFSITFFGPLDFSLKICKIRGKIRLIYPLNFCFQSPFILRLIRMVNIHNFRLNVLFGIFQWKNLNMNIYNFFFLYKSEEGNSYSSFSINMIVFCYPKN